LICRKLIELGCPVRWYAIGPEVGHPVLTRLIRDAGMESYFVLLGEKVNPYPYMAACDIYVQPSRFEGKAVTVREAQILGKPVVITNFSTAPSQLQNGYDGIIVPVEIDACASELKAIIENVALRNTLSCNSLRTDYSNKTEIHKIIEMVPPY
jgi:glycosyltransferase involved in cell wall biosynthesis